MIIEKKTAITTKNAPTPAGPYSQAIVAGDFVFVAGQRPQNPETGEIPDDITKQTEYCINNLESILEEAGTSLANVVRSTVYLSDIKYFDEMNEVYKKRFPETFPARTTFGCQLRGIKIEIDVIALRDKK